MDEKVKNLNTFSTERSGLNSRPFIVDLFQGNGETTSKKYLRQEEKWGKNSWIYPSNGRFPGWSEKSKQDADLVIWEDGPGVVLGFYFKCKILEDS